MSRLSIRPRPLDIHKKLPILKSVKDFEDDDILLSSRHSQFQAENEVQHVPSKRAASEIPTPQYVDVDTYVRDYAQTFIQPNSYLRGRGARAEIGEFVEYDLDNEDDDWLQELNKERKILAPEKLEILLFKLEVLDHKARERAGIIMPTLGSPIHTLLQIDAAIEALQAQSITYGVFQSIFNYWREKRERWQKPILRRLQPPPPASDTNPFNVFRPREKAHRLHTRRMQRRENNAQSFEKLRQIRQNLEQAKIVLEAVIKREEKKRDVMETEVSLQRIQAKYMHESELVEDSLVLPGFPPTPCNFDSSGDEDMYSDDAGNSMPNIASSKPIMASTARLKRELSRRNMHSRWLHKLDPMEPALLFTKPLDEEKLAAAGIMVPPQYTPACKFRGRFGRGGRIVFDRWDPFLNTPIDCGDTFYTPQN